MCSFTEIKACHQPMAVPCRGILAVIGGILVHLTLGTIFTIGNLSPYVTSYIRVYSSPSTLTYSDSTWINAAASMGQGASMFLGGFLERKFGPRIATLMGAWFMSLGIFLTYFTIKISFALCVVSMGLIFGLGVGLGYAVPLACAVKWMPQKKGLVNGFVVAGFGGGAFIFDQIQTQYINSLNKSPDFKDKSNKYFTDEDVLSKVPSCFLVLGGCYAAMQLIGSLMLSVPPKTKPPADGGDKKVAIIELSEKVLKPEDKQDNFFKNEDCAKEELSAKASVTDTQNMCSLAQESKKTDVSRVSLETEVIGFKKLGIFSDGPEPEEKDNSCKVPETCEQDISVKVLEITKQDIYSKVPGKGEKDLSAEGSEPEKPHISSNAAETNEKDSLPKALEMVTVDVSSKEAEIYKLQMSSVVLETVKQDMSCKAPLTKPSPSIVTVKNLRPCEMLKTRAFYTLHCIFILNGMGITFVSSLYKAYGQTFISDDQFMAWVGAFAAVGNASGRILWGHFADRFSFRVSMITMCACFASLMLTMGLTSLGGKPMFFVWVVLLFFTFSGSFSMLPTATVKAFGQTHFAINYGLVFTSQTIIAPITSLLTTQLLGVIGWHGLFFLVSGALLTSCLLAFSFNVKNPDGSDI